MITIKTYAAENTPPEELIHLVQRKYGKSKNFSFFLDDYKKAFRFCSHNTQIKFIPIAGYEKGKILAHCSLIIDSRLKKGEAFFGFLEVSHEEVFTALWKTLLVEAKKQGITHLKGPINGSIWHQYRCITDTDNSDFFKTELPTETYYYQFLRSQHPSFELPYHSAYRKNFVTILPIIQTGYAKLTQSGFSIKELQHITPSELQAIATISKTVFSQSWGYTELTSHEFLALYTSEKVAKHLQTLYVLYRYEKIIGFCSTLKEDEKTLICKTICILPEYQGLGLGNALAYKVHIDAEESGFTKVIYALIRDDNKVKHFPKTDAIIFRKYAAFEFNL